MSKLLSKAVLAVAISSTLLSPLQAHTIGGAYAQLISCVWGQYGYQYGHIGTYNVNGQIIRQFFGSSYCPS